MSIRIKVKAVAIDEAGNEQEIELEMPIGWENYQHEADGSEHIEGEIDGGATFQFTSVPPFRGNPELDARRAAMGIDSVVERKA